MHANHIAFAPIVRKRTATFPSRMASYYDFTKWGGGFLRSHNNGPGAIVLADGVLANIQTGEVYGDTRFAGALT